jgi:DUF4097 and DUF4098 domain-containing protein YvlB
VAPWDETCRAAERTTGMKRFVSFLLLTPLAAVSLTACSFAEVHETVHQSIASSHSPLVRLQNAVGTVRIDGWDKDTVDVVARKGARSVSDLHNIGIDLHDDNGTIVIVTKYSGFMNSGGVEYTVHVPAASSINVHNDTGTVDVTGIGGNVTINNTTGRVTANLGTVGSNRNVDISTATGEVRLTIARDSSATVDANTSIGNVSSDFPNLNENRHTVSDHVTGKIGAGLGTIRLSVSTGSISLRSS